jgi:2,3-bisphosphoglycerate-independent phosphoglycerate mutase
LAASHHKSALLILDGLGDLPVPELGGKTPLEAADTPILDSLATSGEYGLVDPIIPGEIPNTHSGAGMLLGLLPEQAHRLNRGPVEAAGAGRELMEGDIAVRANFATTESRDDALWVLDRRAGRITAGTDELAALLSDVDLGDDVRANLVATDQHRGVLVLSGTGLNASVSDTDPGDGVMPAKLKSCMASNPKAELTARKINFFVQEAHRRLSRHPLNITRVKQGELPANGIITRGAGARFSVDNILHRHGISAAVVSGCNTVLGLGRTFGFDTISDTRFTAGLDTDLDAKMMAVRSALNDHDMVYLHVKAPDICSHDRKPLAKRDFLQRLDKALALLLETDAIIAIAADHTTDSNSGFHTADPVPVLISQAKSGTSNAHTGLSPVKFGEAACRQGTMPRQLSNEFLLNLIQTMGY